MRTVPLPRALTGVLIRVLFCALALTASQARAARPAPRLWRATRTASGGGTTVLYVLGASPVGLSVEYDGYYTRAVLPALRASATLAVEGVGDGEEGPGSPGCDLRQLDEQGIALLNDARQRILTLALRADMARRDALDVKALALRAGTAQLRMRGPGNVALAGTADDLDVEIAGSGDLDASSLTANKATVRGRGPGGVTLARVNDTLDAELHGSGGIDAHLSGKRLLLRMTGPGDARIAGTVAQVDAQLSGSGSLDGHGLTAAHADIAVHGPGTAAVNVTGADARGAGGDQLRHGQLLLVDRNGAHAAR